MTSGKAKPVQEQTVGTLASLSPSGCCPAASSTTAQTVRKNGDAANLQAGDVPPGILSSSTNAASPEQVTTVSYEAPSLHEKFIPKDKFTRGGRRKTNIERDRLMAEAFLERAASKGSGRLGDTALMKKIGQDIKLMNKINGGKTIGRSTAIDAVKNGCALIVRDLATPGVRDALSSGRITAVEAAKRTHREKLSGK
jgi:hypothetical protein